MMTLTKLFKNKKKNSHSYVTCYFYEIKVKKNCKTLMVNLYTQHQSKKKTNERTNDPNNFAQNQQEKILIFFVIYFDEYEYEKLLTTSQKKTK